MKYIISYENPHHHYIDIEFIAGKVNQAKTLVQLPAWRPGRYELGNFAKNVQKWAAFDEKGNPLKFQKITKDCWEVQTKGVSELHIKYNYYGAEINAGSTFLDATQLYMNPVNCCVYIPDRINEPCELNLQLPADYTVACGATPSPSQNAGIKSFILKDFHELADSPFIASNSLQHNKFVCSGVEFNLWFQGECNPDWSKLTSDFIKFINEQMMMMKSFPCEAYHFIFQILPYKTYHGVEHITSTIITLGPGSNLMNGDLYEDLLAVSSHELVHVWNIKTIRPTEMLPYDYTKENYSKLGYVCEGVTTYYGDYLLYRSAVFNEKQYLQALGDILQKHFDNFGRFNLSVADSSFDTWLDGYVPGIPNRKTNIYTEGCLLAFVTDLFIRKNSTNKHSIDDVLRYLYTEFALKNKGYSDADYKGVVEHFANKSFDEIFNKYINGVTDYQPLLNDAMNYIGCELIFTSSPKFHEHAIGIKVQEAAGSCKVIAVYPASVADKSGITINDELLVINNMQIKSDGTGTTFSEWCNYFSNKNSSAPLILTVSTNGTIKQIKLQPEVDTYYKIAQMKKQTTVSEQQKNNFEIWSKNKF